jgi:hypothetical protein
MERYSCKKNNENCFTNENFLRMLQGIKIIVFIQVPFLIELLEFSCSILRLMASFTISARLL